MTLIDTRARDIWLLLFISKDETSIYGNVDGCCPSRYQTCARNATHIYDCHFLLLVTVSRIPSTLFRTMRWLVARSSTSISHHVSIHLLPIRNKCSLQVEPNVCEKAILSRSEIGTKLFSRTAHYRNATIFSSVNPVYCDIPSLR